MARDLSRNRKKTIHINRCLENKIAILREPILLTWQCSCKECRKQAALARWAKDHPACEPSVFPAWRLPTNPMFILLSGCSRGQYSSRLARIQSRIVHGKIPSPACGGRGSHEKKCSHFFHGYPGRWPQAGRGGIRNQHLSRLAAAYKPSIYPAWPLPANPAFIPLGRCPRIQRLSRLVAAHKPSVYPAWRLPTSPVFIPLDAHPIPNRAWENPFPRLRGKVAAGRKGEIQNQRLSRLVAFCSQKKPACAGFSRRGKTLYSVAMSITKRYLTSLFSIRS